MGRKVVMLFEDVVPTGIHSISWDAKDQTSGVYFIHMQANGFNAYKKVMLIK